MDKKTKFALDYHRGSFQMFLRNGRWGTCMDCPRDSEGNGYPEFCSNTERHDHHLTFDGLVENYKHTLNRA
jgi:hypothetical protein